MLFDLHIDYEYGCKEQIRTKWNIVGKETATLWQLYRFILDKERRENYE